MGDKRTLEMLREAHKASGGYGWKYRKAEALVIQKGNRKVLERQRGMIKVRSKTVSAYLKTHEGALLVSDKASEGLSETAIMIADMRLKGETFKAISDILEMSRQAVHANFHKTLKRFRLVNLEHSKQ